MLKSLVTTVATAAEVPGAALAGFALEHLGEPADRDRGREARPGRPPRPAGRTAGPRPRPRPARGRVPRRAGRPRGPRPARTGAGFTNRDTTTKSHSSRARRMSDRWPRGSSPSSERGRSCARPARSGASAARSSATVRTVSCRHLRDVAASAPGVRARARRRARAARGGRLGHGLRAEPRRCARPRGPPARSAPRSGPSSARFSTVRRSRGTSSARASSGSRPAPAAMRSAAASRVTRKFEAIDAAAW